MQLCAGHFLVFCFAYFFYFMASNAVTSAFSKYASQVWGAGGGSFANFQLVATMVTLISYMPMANISCRIGRKLTTYIGIGLMCFGGFCIFMTQGYSPLIYVFVSISGVGMGTVATTIYPMIMEVASEKNDRTLYRILLYSQYVSADHHADPFRSGHGIYRLSLSVSVCDRLCTACSIAACNGTEGQYHFIKKIWIWIILRENY